MYHIYTRKQIWRKCMRRCNFKKNLKVRFSNVVSVIYIPTKEEEKKTNFFYNSFQFFVK